MFQIFQYFQCPSLLRQRESPVDCLMHQHRDESTTATAPRRRPGAGGSVQQAEGRRGPILFLYTLCQTGTPTHSATGLLVLVQACRERRDAGGGSSRLAVPSSRASYKNAQTHVATNLQEKLVKKTSTAVQCAQ